MLGFLIAMSIAVLLTTIWIVVDCVRCFRLTVVDDAVSVGVVTLQVGEVFVNLVASFDDIVPGLGVLLLLCLARVAYRRVLKSVTVED